MENTYKKYTWIAGTLAFVAIAFSQLSSGLHDLNTIKHPNGQMASITVTGEGEVTALPDVATITLTVREEAKTVPEAQKVAEAKVAQVLKSLNALNIEKKDTKTLSYTINPKYEPQTASYCVGYTCPPVKTVVVGYEVAQTIQINVRKIDQAGEVIGVIGKANITEVSGPEFKVEDMDKAKAEAKAIAIKKAEDKAKVTAKALHVGLGSILSFSEDNGGNYPMYARAEMMSMKVVGASDAVSLPQGESVIKSTVTITYTLE